MGYIRQTLIAICNKIYTYFEIIKITMIRDEMYRVYT